MAKVDGERPTLIMGFQALAYLDTRKKEAKRPMALGEFYCFRCKAPKEALGAMADYMPISDAGGRLAADPKRLGARCGMTCVLHTWGSSLTHHPHIHMIVPGGGLSKDGNRWITCKPGFFLHVRVLSRLFRRLFIEGLLALHHTGQLAFFGDLTRLSDADAFAAYLAPLHKTEWVVYAKPPFGGPEQVLTYLSRYTHRVAISNSRLVSADADTVTFRWKDYRVKSDNQQKTMQLATPEFIRRFLTHVLPDRFHRIRHYGLLASAGRVLVAKLKRTKAPITAADLLNDRVLPFHEENDLPVLRILTDRGAEYCGRVDKHDFQLFLAINDIDHTKTKVKSPQTNGICERFHKTIRQEFYQVAFRKKAL